MFARIKTCKNRDGSTRKYYQICESKRFGDKVQQKVLANLGRVEDLQEGKLDDLIRSLVRFSEKMAVIDAANDLFADWSKEYGPALVFRRIWENLGLSDIFKKTLATTEIAIDIEEAVFCMVLNRLTEPTSKAGVEQWKDTVHRPEFETLKLNHFYKALDFLDEHIPSIEEALFARHTDLFTRQLDLVFFDTTSTYLEGPVESVDMARFGYSKDHRPDRLQIMVGILMSRDGIPIAHHVFPGNTPDTEAFMEAVTGLKERFNIQRVIVVGDRGMMGKKTVELLNNLGLQYILGVRMRNIKASTEVLKDKSPYVKVADNLQVKEVVFDGTRYIVCLNEEEAKRDRHVREEVVAKLSETLKNNGIKSLVGNSAYQRYLNISTSSASINESKIKEDELFDGKYLLQTDTELPVNEVALAYKDLWQIERAFRDLKTTLELRPMYHWTERRICGHIALCFIALVMQITFQKLLKENGFKHGFTQTMRELRKVHAVKIRVKDKEHIVRTEITGAANDAFRAIGLKVPPRVE